MSSEDKFNYHIDQTNIKLARIEHTLEEIMANQNKVWGIVIASSVLASALFELALNYMRHTP